VGCVGRAQAGIAIPGSRLFVCSPARLCLTLLAEVLGSRNAGAPKGRRGQVFMCIRVLSRDAQRALRSFGARAFAFALFAFLHANTFSGAALAQDFLGPGPILPGYEAPGIKIDDFFMKQAVSIGIAYDSNILQSHSNAIQDYIFFVSPTVDITHDGGSHIEELLVSATTTRYFKSETDDYTDVYVKASEAYSLSSADSIAFNTSLSDGYQRRIITNFELLGNPAAPIHELILRHHTRSNHLQ
jgi:hypothetical protein